MNKNKAKTIVAIAEVFGEEFTDSRLRAYLFALEDLSEIEIARAAKEALKDPELRRMPLPGKLIEYARPSVSIEDEAREAAARAIKSIRKFGWNNPKEAREYMGEVAWKLVDMQGGWVTFSQDAATRDLNQKHAQLRDLAVTQVKRARAGILDKAPALPDSRGKGGLTQAGDIMTGVLGSLEDNWKEQYQKNNVNVKAKS